MKTQTVIDFSELRFLSIECPVCKTKLVLDVTVQGRDVPAACSACGEPFGAVKNHVGHFIRIYGGVKESGCAVRFEIEAADKRQ